MSKNPWIILLASLCLFVAASSPPVLAEDGGSEGQPRALTTADPEIPVEELKLMLNPLTKDELLLEASAWQALLREKAIEISKAEIAVKRQNREISKAEEIQEQAEDVRERLEDLQDKAEEAKESRDQEKILETREAAEQAHAEMEELSASVEAAAEAAERTAEVRARLSEETLEELSETADAAGTAQQAIDRAKEAVEDADVDDEASMLAAAGEVRDSTREAAQATERAKHRAGEAVEAATADQRDAGEAVVAAEAFAEVRSAKEEAKIRLLGSVNRLREDRTMLIDRLRAVLEELETKTDDDDSDTLAKIKDYRLYIKAASGISLDVKDTTSAWIAIKGWVLSEEGGLRWVRNLGSFLGILLVAWFLSKALSRAVRRAFGVTDKVSQLLEDFLVGAVRWVVLIVGVLMALSSLEISVGPLLAVVGAAGFIIALALQDSLSNFASGIMILFFRPFDVGDVVDAGGVSGSVTTMNLVSTTIKTFDNKQMVVPNNKIWNDVITNATGVQTRRVDMEFGIGYDDDVDQAQGILDEIVKSHPDVLASPEPTIRMHTLADSSVNFICRPWAKTEDYWGVYWDVTKEVKKRFDAAGIGIPFPQRDVHLYLENAPAKTALAGPKAQRPAQGPSPKSLELDDPGNQEDDAGR